MGRYLMNIIFSNSESANSVEACSQGYKMSITFLVVDCSDGNLAVYCNNNGMCDTRSDMVSIIITLQIHSYRCWLEVKNICKWNSAYTCLKIMRINQIWGLLKHYVLALNFDDIRIIWVHFSVRLVIVYMTCM